MVPKWLAPQCLLLAFKEKFDLGDFYVLDTWPFGPPMILACSPKISDQFVVARSMPKGKEVLDFMIPIAGKENMVSDEGERWRVWRRAFNPGFSAAHLMTLAPDIIEHVKVFCQILESHAKNDKLFRMEKCATRLTIDIIGKIVLDTEFGSQTRENELVSAFESQVRWMPIGAVNHPEEILDLRRPFVLWWNSHVMRRYLSNQLEQRFAQRSSRNNKSRYVVDLAFDVYMKEKGLSPEKADRLDPTFKEAAVAQIRTFIFAGHDTSSGAICYCFYHLSRNPSVLATLRRECDQVLGEDITQVTEVLKNDPHLINKMEYLNAVIRESLRMHPPASSMRHGAKE